MGLVGDKKEQGMKTAIGLWIDHHQAVIVRIFDQREEISRIISNLPKHIRFSGVSYDRSEADPHDDTSENKRDRRFEGLLKRYYDKVIAKLENSDAIFIIGPGAAKTELHKRLEHKKLSTPNFAVEAADKMTENQIVAKVRQHFQDIKTQDPQQP
jgi:hypothetical protein